MTSLPVTSRPILRGSTGVCTHFNFTGIYSTRWLSVVEAIKALRVGWVRGRATSDPEQTKAFTALAAAGVRLYLNVGDMSASDAEIIRDINTIANSDYADAIAAVAGPNEANDAGGAAWPGRVTHIQQTIWEQVASHQQLNQATVVGPVLKHNVKGGLAQLDKDYKALADAGIGRWCNLGDFHYYPGSSGPATIAGERNRARQAYGDKTLFMSETGWTETDTHQSVSGPFTVEAYLRNHLTGIAATFIYEFCDESATVPGREGHFGIVQPDLHPKSAYTLTQMLLNGTDGPGRFPGRLHAVDDAHAVVLSDPDGFDVYLLRQDRPTATLAIDKAYTAFGYHREPNGRNNWHWPIDLDDSMTVVRVIRA